MGAWGWCVKVCKVNIRLGKLYRKLKVEKVSTRTMQLESRIRIFIVDLYRCQGRVFSWLAVVLYSRIRLVSCSDIVKDKVG